MPGAGPQWPSAPFRVPHSSWEKTQRRKQGEEEARMCVRVHPLVSLCVRVSVCACVSIVIGPSPSLPAKS